MMNISEKKRKEILQNQGKAQAQAQAQCEGLLPRVTVRCTALFRRKLAPATTNRKKLSIIFKF